MFNLGAKLGVQGDQEFIRSFERIGDSVKLANSQLKAAMAQFDKADQSEEKLTRQNELLGKSLDGWKEKLGMLNTNLDTQKAKLSTLANALEEAKKGGEGNAAEVAKAEAAYNAQAKVVNNCEIEIAKATEQINKMERQVKENNAALGQADTAAKNFGSQMQNIANSAQQVGQKLDAAGKSLMPLTGAVAAVGAGAVKSFADVDKGLDTIVKKTGATGNAVTEFKDIYSDIAAEVPAELNDIGAAIGELNTRLNLTGGELKTATVQFLKFAGVNDLDVNSSIQLVTRAMGDAGIAAADYGSVLDMLTVAGQKSGISIDTLSQNLAKYGAPMRALGIDTQHAIALFAGWEKAGVNTEIAFSGMKKAISNWGKAGKDSTVEFQKTLDAIKACPDIASATSMAIDVFGAKAGPDLADAIRGGRFEIGEYIEALEKAGGTVDSTFSETQDGIDGAKTALNSLKMAGAELGGVISDSLAPIFKGLASAARDFAAWFGGLSDGMKRAILIVGGLVAALGPLLIFVGKMATGVSVLINIGKTMIPVIKAIGAAMSANPVGAIITAIAALVTAFITLWNTSEDFRNFWIGLWDTISGAFSAAWDGIVNFFTKTIPDAFNGFINWIKKNWQGLLLLLVNPIAGAFKLIYDNCEGFHNFINNFVQSVKNFFVNGWNAIVAFFTETIPAWIASVVEWFNELPRKIGEMIGALIGHVIQFGINLWSWVTVELPQIIQAVVDWFAQLPGRIWEWLKSAALKVAQWGVDVYTAMKTKVEEAITAVVDWFAALPGKIWDWLAATVQKVIQWGVNLRDKAKQAATDMVTNVVDTIKSLPRKIMDIGKNIVTGLWEGIQSMVGWIKDKISGFLGGIVDGVKGVLGIHSPSKVFAGIGEYMGEGLGIGFADSMRTVASRMQNAIPTTLTGPSLANVAGAAAGNTGATVAASPVSVVLRIDNFNNYSQDDLATISDMVAAQIQDKVTRQQGVFR